EDGIRDDLVTGVQTCALPILSVGFAEQVLKIYFTYQNQPHYSQPEQSDQNRDQPPKDRNKFVHVNSSFAICYFCRARLSDHLIKIGRASCRQRGEKTDGDGRG